MEFIFEIIFEIIFELVFEGGLEVSKSNKIPKYIRYPLIGIISLCFIAVIGFVFIAGIVSLKEDYIFVGIFLIILALFLLIMSVIKFRKAYLAKINKK